MRVREVEIHHADLGLDYTAADWTADFVALLLDSRSASYARPGGLHRPRHRPGPLVDVRHGGPTVSGVGSALAWWATGRGTGDGLTSDDGRVPRIEAW